MAAVYCLGLTNVVTDLMLMAIPARIISRSKLPTKTKIELAAIFLLGFVVIIFSTLTMIIILMHWAQQKTLVWRQIECFAATIVANAPILHGLWRHGINHLRRFSCKQTDDCPPAYNVAVRQPTESHDSTLEMTEQPPPRRSRRDRARQSVRISKHSSSFF